MLIGAQQVGSEFVKPKKNHAKKTAGQLKEMIAESLEALAYRLTLLIEKLAQAQYLLIDRMHELAAGDSKGIFSGASHKDLQHYVVRLEEEVARAEQTLKELTSLNKLLKEK